MRGETGIHVCQSFGRLRQNCLSPPHVHPTKFFLRNSAAQSFLPAFILRICHDLFPVVPAFCKILFMAFKRLFPDDLSFSAANF